jgi:hypothetical protein
MKSVVGYFDDESSLLHATEEARKAGVDIVDAFTPYAVHGLDRVMGLRRSRLTFVCFAAAMMGATFALSLQIYTSSVAWPINVGGKPFVSWPAFIPVAFELTVLFAALISAFAFFGRSKLFPGSQQVALPRVTDDRFALVLQADGDAASALLRAVHAIDVEELIASNGAKS